MRKVFLFIVLIFFTISKTLACSIPPDILNRFYIYQENENVKIKYSLYVWEDFVPRINSFFKEKTQKDLNSENIDIFIEYFLKNNIDLTLNGEEIDLKFDSVKFFKNFTDSNPYFEIDFSTNINSLKETNIFKVDYQKKIFSDITTLTHAFFYSDIEENLDFDGYTQVGEDYFDNFYFNGIKYGVLSLVEDENDKHISYVLKIKNLGKSDNSSEKYKKNLK